MLRINFLFYGCWLVLWAGGGVWCWDGMWGAGQREPWAKGGLAVLWCFLEQLPTVPTGWSQWAPDDHLGVLRRCGSCYKGLPAKGYSMHSWALTLNPTLRPLALNAASWNLNWPSESQVFWSPAHSRGWGGPGGKREGIHSPICWLILSFIHSWMHAFNSSFMYSFIHSSLHKFIYVFLYSFTLICSVIYLIVIHLWMHYWIINSHIHWHIYSFAY